LFGKQKCIKQYIWNSRKYPLLFPAAWRPYESSSSICSGALTSLLAGQLPPKPLRLGMVMHAERAHIGVEMLRREARSLRRPALYGGRGRFAHYDSRRDGATGWGVSMVLGHTGSEENTCRVTYGVSVFSAAPARQHCGCSEWGARPAGRPCRYDAHVQIVNRKRLRIYAATRGTGISYHGENATIPEGTNTAAVLDPSEKEVAAAAAASGQTPNPAHRGSPDVYFWWRFPLPSH